MGEAGGWVRNDNSDVTLMHHFGGSVRVSLHKISLTGSLWFLVSEKIGNLAELRRDF